MVTSISRTTDSGLDPRPATDNTNVYSENLPDGIDVTDYRGAFKAGADNWLNGWSALSQYGYLVK